MIRTKYLLSQEQCCGLPGQFVIHELSDNLAGQQKSQTSQLAFSPQQYVGQFKQSNVSRICCCSFRPIRSLQLQIYGQRLSQASSQSTCCLGIWSGELVVSTTNNVLIGTIKKRCSLCCSESFIGIENEQGKQIFTINVKCCQMANLCPRILKFKSELVYTINNSEGKEVGTIINLYRSCINNVFNLRDDFQIIFAGVEKQKQKILLLNAVVFINQLKHQFL